MRPPSAPSPGDEAAFVRTSLHGIAEAPLIEFVLSVGECCCILQAWAAETSRYPVLGWAWRAWFRCEVEGHKTHNPLAAQALLDHGVDGLSRVVLQIQVPAGIFSHHCFPFRCQGIPQGKHASESRLKAQGLCNLVLKFSYQL